MRYGKPSGGSDDWTCVLTFQDEVDLSLRSRSRLVDPLPRGIQLTREEEGEMTPF